MTKVTEAATSATGSPVIICDVSPPRGGDPALLEDTTGLGTDFLSIAYNPGQSVRVNSVVCAAYLQQRFGKQTTFTLATRDLNRIAIQSLLLGADLLGLENVVVLRGDGLRKRDENLVRPVHDYSTTGLLQDISRLNDGVDFRGLKLRSPTTLCAGSVVDIGHGLGNELALTSAKVEVGAQFFLCQPHFDVGAIQRFTNALHRAPGTGRNPLLFWGVQVPHPDGVDFGNVPDNVRDDLRTGRTGLEIAAELAERLWEIGTRHFYVVPPIFRSGRRDYEQADALIDHIRRLC